MRYNVHSPCAFRNRIARYLGVLVAAALVAVLGLPSAAQAQTPAAPDVEGVRRRHGRRRRRHHYRNVTTGGRILYRRRQSRWVAGRIYRA